jgi:hypothetical protein
LDEFGHALWQDDPETVSAVIDTLVSKRRHPPVTRGALIQQIERTFSTLAADLTT